MQKNKADNKYLRYAKRIKYFKYFIIVIFFLFVLTVVSLFKDEITIKNFRYLIKYIDVDPPNIGENYTKINFDGNMTSHTGVYKDDLVVVTKTSLSIYDISGRKVFTDSFAMSNPAFVVSNRYIAVYDLGSNYVAVYNFFSKLWEHTFDYPIYNVDINDNGDFCVVSAAKGYHSAVYVYNSDFKSVYNWYSADKYVYDISLCKNDGTKFALACVKASNGDFLTEVINFSTESDQVQRTMPFVGEMAIDIEYMSDERMLLLTDSSLKFISDSGDVKNFDFASNSLKNYAADDKYVVLALNEDFVGNRYTINVFNPDGELLTCQYIDENISDVDIGDENICVLAIENVYSIDPKNEKIKSFGVDRSYKAIYSYDKNVVLLILDSSAVAVNISDSE